MSEQHAGGWPDATRPGYPADPERDGWHWIKMLHGDAPFQWRAAGECERGRWDGRWLYGVDEHDPADCEYVGPALTPAEVAAREAAARREGIEAAASAVRELEPHLSALKARDYPDDMLILLDDAERTIRALLEDGR